MEDNRKITCEGCRKTVLVSDVRYVLKGKEGRMALCSACRERTDVSNMAKKESEKTTFKKPTPTITKVSSDGRQIFICERCKYKFKFDMKSPSSLKCPFCGKSDKLVKENATSASNLLSEVDY